MKFWPVLTVLFFLNSLIFSDQPEIRIQAQPESIGLNEAATVVIETSEKPVSVDGPDSTPGYSLEYRGATVSRMDMDINGQRSSRTTYIHSFAFYPKKQGPIQAGPFTVKVGGSEYRTQRVTINVGPERKSSAFGIFDEIEEMMGIRRSRVPEMAIEIRSGGKDYRVNEQIVLEAVMLTDRPEVFNWNMVQATGLQFKSGFLEQQEWDVINAPVVREGGLYRKTIGRFAYFPVEPGGLQFTQVPSYVVLTPYGQVQVKTVRAPDIKIKAGGTGAGLSYIGSLSARAWLETNQSEAGRPIELTVVLTGDGNLKTFYNPYQGLEAKGYYLSMPRENNQTEGREYGRLQFRRELIFTLVPETPGVIRIPPVILDYRTTEGTAAREEIRPMVLIVTGASNKADGAGIPTFRNAIKGRFSFILSSAAAWALVAAALIAPAGCGLWGLYRKKLSDDPGFARRRQTAGKIKSLLSEAEADLEENDFRGAARALQKTLFTFYTDRYGLPSGITWQDIKARLLSSGKESAFIETADRLYQDCGRAAYGGTDQSAVRELLRRTRDMVRAR